MFSLLCLAAVICWPPISYYHHSLRILASHSHSTCHHQRQLWYSPNILDSDILNFYNSTALDPYPNDSWIQRIKASYGEVKLDRSVIRAPISYFWGRMFSKRVLDRPHQHHLGIVRNAQFWATLQTSWIRNCGVGLGNVWSNQSFQVIPCTLKFENHWSLFLVTILVPVLVLPLGVTSGCQRLLFPLS